MPGDIEQISGDGANPWIAKIKQSQDAEGITKWKEACKKIKSTYRYESSASAKVHKYQMLWSNIEVMKGATYAKPPKAEVMRRYNDKDDTARQATLMIERCINFTLDVENYDEKFKQVRDDYLLFARGAARVVYEPVMEAVSLPDDGLDASDIESPSAELSQLEGEAQAAGDDLSQEILTFERVKIKYVERGDFAHEPARTWEEVKWVAFRSFLDRDDLIKRFGEDLGKKISLDAKAEESSGARQRDGAESKATIWEVWDKAANRVLWVAQSWPDVLEEGEPYLKLSGFWPCPRPAYGTMTNDTLVPRPDYVFYQDQAEEINRLTARIASLQDSLKVVGFYPAGPAGEGAPEVERAVTPGVENRMIAVKGWAMFTEGGKSGVPIVWFPIDQIIKVLEGCVKLRSQLIEDVYQITGISDIVRGATDPQETKGAQVLKSQHGALRLKTKQEELARFCRDICRLVGEVICNHFQPETIMAMSNMPLPTDAEVLQQMQMQQAQQELEARLQAQRAALAAAAPMGGPPPAPNGPAGPPMQPRLAQAPMGAPA